jgi:hypothetical protein|tara:strand:- start:641 stop:2557 length:1917 start_codon:yes stop_codon:yes gene_type:complete
MAEDPKKLAEAQKIANEALREGNDLTRTFGRLLQDNIKSAGRLNDSIKNNANIIQRQIQDRKSQASFTERLNNVEKDITDSLAKREGIGKRYFGKNQAYGQNLVKQVNTSIKGLEGEKERLETLIKVDGITGGLVTKAQSFARAITVGAIFTSLVAAAKKFGETLDTIGQQFGSLDVLGKPVTDNLLDSQIEAIKLGGSIQDVASITNTLASNFGMSLEEASKLSGKVFDTSKALGLSADESANLFGSLTQVANLSAEQAESLAEGAFQLARQRGVAPSAVLRDIAGSAEEIALFTKGGGDNIAEAAVQARSLGLSLSQTAKIAEGLLDFENSITKEVEASVLIGRQLNLQKAREAALSGDIAGAMEEVVKQVGSEQDFLNLNLIQRKALADSIGVSVNEMAKLVGQSDKLSLSGAMATGNFGDLLGQEGISNISAIVGQFKALTANLVNELGPTIEKVVGEFSEFVSKGGGVEAIGGAIKLVATSISTILNNLPLLIAGFTALKTVQAGVALSSIFPALASSAKFGGPVGVAATVAAILAGMATLKAVAVDDFTSGPGGITTMMGPAGIFSLNPRDSVLATTNPIPVNDMMTGPAGSMNTNANVNVAVGGRISGRDIIFFQQQGAEFAGGANGEGMA